MDRREVLRSVAVMAALPFVPRTAEGALAFGQAIHGRLTGAQAYRTLSIQQQAIVSALADGILPRTDTPGATDVGVPAFIDLMLTEWYDDADRDEILAGLDAIDGLARSGHGAPLADLAEPGLTAVLRDLDARRTEPTGAGATFGRIKSLTVYGYFTSEPVSRDVLRTQVFFEDFDGCAPVGG